MHTLDFAVRLTYLLACRKRESFLIERIMYVRLIKIYDPRFMNKILLPRLLRIKFLGRKAIVQRQNAKKNANKRKTTVPRDKRSEQCEPF